MKPNDIKSLIAAALDGVADDVIVVGIELPMSKNPFKNGNVDAAAKKVEEAKEALAKAEEEYAKASESAVSVDKLADAVKSAVQGIL